MFTGTLKTRNKKEPSWHHKSGAKIEMLDFLLLFNVETEEYCNIIYCGASGEEITQFTFILWCLMTKRGLCANQYFSFLYAFIEKKP